MRDTLKDGAVRLRDGGCTTIVSRLRPGLALLTIVGHDNGQNRDELGAELRREWGRFRLPLDLACDASASPGATNGVPDWWLGFFVGYRSKLARVRILPSQSVRVTVEIVKHLSRTGDLIQVLPDARAFEESLARDVPGFRLPAGREGEPAVSISRTVLEDGTVRITGPTCSFVYARPRPGALLVTITGNDTGDLGALPLDEMTDGIAALPPPLELFVDTSGAGSVASRVREEWTAWFVAHGPSLRRIHVLTGSRFFQMTVSVAKELSRTAELIRIHDSPASFEKALGQRSS
jgi:hypothetical protein